MSRISAKVILVGRSGTTHDAAALVGREAATDLAAEAARLVVDFG